MLDLQRSIIGSAIQPFRIVFLMWLTFTANFVYDFPVVLSNYGIIPRNLPGLVGVFTAPILHANLQHILSNTFPLLFLGAVIFYFYPVIARKVLIIVYFSTNLLVWIFARHMNHIGASGLIYGFASFLVVYGLLRRDIYSMVISLVTMASYGYLIYGVLPVYSDLSWEMHIAGVVSGVFCAFQYKNVNIKA